MQLLTRMNITGSWFDDSGMTLTVTFQTKSSQRNNRADLTVT